MSSLDCNVKWQVDYWTKMSHQRVTESSLQYDISKERLTSCTAIMADNNEKTKRGANHRVTFAQEHQEFINPSTKYFYKSLRAGKSKLYH